MVDRVVQAESSLARYGRPLLLALPNEMTDMLIDLCAGSPPTSDSPDQEDATAVPSKSGGPSYLSYLAYNKGSLPLTLDSAPPATPVTTTSTTTAVPQDFTPGHQRGASSNRRSHFDGESSRASSPPLGNAPAPRRTPARKRPSPRQYFAHFVDHPKNFQQFLEAIALRRWRLSVGEDLNPSISQQIPDASAVAGDNDKDDQTAVWNTLLELYLSQRALQSEEADSSILLQQKAMAILERDSIFHYDPMHALIVCTTRDFTSGLVLLWEKMGMYEDILRFWMEKENSGELHDDSITQNQPSHQVLSHLDKYGPAHPHLYTLVLRFLTSTPALLSRHTPDVMRILGRIDQDKIIPPLGVIQILSRNGVASVGLVKEWLMTRISESREEINAVSLLPKYLSVKLIYYIMLRIDILYLLIVLKLKRNSRRSQNFQTQTIQESSMSPGARPVEDNWIYRAFTSCVNTATTKSEPIPSLSDIAF